MAGANAAIIRRLRGIEIFRGHAKVPALGGLDRLDLSSRATSPAWPPSIFVSTSLSHLQSALYPTLLSSTSAAACRLLRCDPTRVSVLVLGLICLVS